MTSRFTRIAAGAASVLAASATVLLAPVAAHASGTTPPWEPDPNAVGTLSFYDASGNQVTSGSVTDKPIAAYVVGSQAIRAGDVNAGMQVAQPNPDNVTGLWSVDTLSSFTPYPVTSGPTNIKDAGDRPVVTGSSGDLSLGDFINEFPNTDPSGTGCAYSTGNPAGCTNTQYQNLYQIRVVTGNSSGQQTSNYEVADVLVTNATYSSGQITGGTWTQVYPPASSGQATTTTTVSASPASPVKQGTQVTLTARVAASDTTKPAGTVQFAVNGSNFGSPVAVDTTGANAVATLATKSLPVGTDTIGAVFTPSDTTAYSGSTATPIHYTVNRVVKALRNVAKPRLSGKGKVGATEKVSKGKWSPTPSSYHYQWLLNGKAIKHATKSSYRIPRKDKGKKLSCRVTASKSGYKSASATSNTIRVKR